MFRSAASICYVLERLHGEESVAQLPVINHSPEVVRPTFNWNGRWPGNARGRGFHSVWVLSYALYVSLAAPH